MPKIEFGKGGGLGRECEGGGQTQINRLQRDGEKRERKEGGEALVIVCGFRGIIIKKMSDRWDYL